MTKGLQSAFIGLYAGILKDAYVYHPTLRKDCERDLSRLKTLSTNMGIKVFTLMLPALSKILDRALDSGALTFSGEPLTRSVNGRTVIPRLFRGFWSAIFEDNGVLKQDIDTFDVLILRTLLLAGKKYNLKCSDSAKFLTLKEFFDVDETLPPPSLYWDGDGSDLGTIGSHSFEDFGTRTGDLFCREDRGIVLLLRTAQQCADRVSGYLGEFVPSVSRFRHGPGASSDLSYRKDFKYSFRENCWNPRLQWVFPASVFGLPNTRDVALTNSYDEGNIPQIESASKLHAVPKTQKSPRLIAAEPSSNQWCQQSVRDYLADAISACFVGDSIDFSRQDLSGDLALAASVSGELATIDLSSASDRLSCAVVERMFRKNGSLLSAMIACRTRFVTNDLDKKTPSLHKLRKFASMGSALTFPVQSIVFYTLCLAAGIVAEQATMGEMHRLGKKVRVYGDDLIVPVLWVPFIEQLFSTLHLKINVSKTYTGEHFRESCGYDCFNGDWVSPGQVREFYDESKLSTLQGVVDASNNLFSKGLWNASQALLSTVQPAILRMVPSVRKGSRTFGLLSFSGSHFPSRKRWNHDLQRQEALVLTFESKRDKPYRHDGVGNLLQFFTEDPAKDASDVLASEDNLLVGWASGVVSTPLPVARKRWVAVE